MQILQRAVLEQRVGLDTAALAVIEAGFAALGRGEVVMPPVLSMAIAEHHGEVDVKTAHIQGGDYFAIKISPGFFDNPKLGLPSLLGLMVVFCAKTGQVVAVLFDEGYLTDIRTALAGALAARWLAREDAQRVSVLGAGRQAELQVAALTLVRPIQSVAVYARRPEQAAAYAARMQQRYGLPVTCHASPAEACRKADIVVTTTPARQPVLFWDALPAGVHVTAMGADSPEKNELDPVILSKADHVVADWVLQSRRLGELQHAPDLQREVHELGHLIAQGRRLRQCDSAVTVCDLTGLGIQDTAIATYAVKGK